MIFKNEKICKHLKGVTVIDIHKLYKALRYNKEKSRFSGLMQNKTFTLVNLQVNAS